MNLAFLVSGNGTNMKAIIDACLSNELNATPKVLITNNSNCGAIKIARSFIDCYCLKKFDRDYSICNILLGYNIDLVILAGYSRKIGPLTLKEYKNRILNIHPALLPKFGGKGMYGLAVHKAVIEAGEKESGATVHLIDNEYDHGRILNQNVIPVLQNDTPEILAKRVLKIEHKLYIEAVKMLLEDLSLN